VLGKWDLLSGKSKWWSEAMDRNGFWRDSFALKGSIITQVFPLILTFGLISAVICVLDWMVERAFDVQIGLEVAPHEIAGAALGLMLILRTNAGYDRWWEARKLWGGIVNQSRNLVISALSYGPTDPEWRDNIVRWTSVFPHIARCSLRGQKPNPEVLDLVGQVHFDAIANSQHMPSYVVYKIATLLMEGREKFQLDPFSFQQIDKERALLIDHVGACERILKTPLPIVYSIKIRRFIMLFLVTLPFALLHKMDIELLIPLITMLVAYPLISLDQIGIELQNPFSGSNLNHLPLRNIVDNIQANLAGLQEVQENEDSLLVKTPR
jgi:putative membrane protein